MESYHLKPENNRLRQKVVAMITDMLFFKDDFPAAEDRQPDEK